MMHRGQAWLVPVTEASGPQHHCRTDPLGSGGCPEDVASRRLADERMKHAPPNGHDLATIVYPTERVRTSALNLEGWWTWGARGTRIPDLYTGSVRPN